MTIYKITIFLFATLMSFSSYASEVCAFIDAGDSQTVGLRSDGTVVAAGPNFQGQINVDSWTDIVQVNTDHEGTLGLRSDGTVIAVGTNFGQLNVQSWNDIVQISLGDLYTIGLKSNGTVVGVGYEMMGTELYDVSSWTDIVQVSAGNNRTIGLKSNGKVIALGETGPLDVESWTDIIKVSTGNGCIFGVKSNGTVLAMGANTANVESWVDIVQVEGGWSHTVGLKSNGTVVAVGSNTYGQLNVDSWTDIVQVVTGTFHTVGLKADGTVVAVGRNHYGSCDVSGWNLGTVTPTSTDSYTGLYYSSPSPLPPQSLDPFGLQYTNSQKKAHYRVLSKTDALINDGYAYSKEEVENNPDLLENFSFQSHFNAIRNSSIFDNIPEYAAFQHAQNILSGTEIAIQGAISAPSSTIGLVLAAGQQVFPQLDFLRYMNPDTGPVGGMVSDIMNYAYQQAEALLHQIEVTIAIPSEFSMPTDYAPTIFMHRNSTFGDVEVTNLQLTVDGPGDSCDTTINNFGSFWFNDEFEMGETSIGRGQFVEITLKEPVNFRCTSLLDNYTVTLMGWINGSPATLSTTAVKVKGEKLEDYEILTDLTLFNVAGLYDGNLFFTSELTSVHWTLAEATLESTGDLKIIKVAQGNSYDLREYIDENKQYLLTGSAQLSDQDFWNEDYQRVNFNVLFTKKMGRLETSFSEIIDVNSNLITYSSGFTDPISQTSYSPDNLNRLIYSEQNDLSWNVNQGETSLPQTITIHNGGSQPVNISDLSPLQSPFSLYSSSCTEILSGQSCNIQINIETELPGHFPGVLEITSNAHNRPLITIPLDASIDAIPQILVTTPEDNDIIEHDTSTMLFTGAANDDNLITRIEFKLNDNAEWNVAQGTTSWQFTMTNIDYGETSVLIRAVDDQLNFSEIITKKITRQLPPAPTVDFAGTPRESLNSTTVIFTLQINGIYDSIQWDFGDGTYSNTINPNHTYSSPGEYDVDVVVMGPGGVAIESKNNYIKVYSPVEASFTYTPLSGSAPLTISFSNTSSGSFDTSTWDFGDGGSSSEMNPQHTYLNSGEYTIVLEVSGGGGTDVRTVDAAVTVLQDTDSDSVADIYDNCPDVSNLNQKNFDNDSQGDICDEDDDDDGMPDEWELQYGLDPFSNDALLDTDNDGISNIDEFLNDTSPVIKQGDIDGDSNITLKDAIVGLRVLTLNADNQSITKNADVNGDNMIGIAEVLFVLNILDDN